LRRARTRVRAWMIAPTPRARSERGNLYAMRARRTYRRRAQVSGSLEMEFEPRTRTAESL
jgi:hypothetical protein